MKRMEQYLETAKAALSLLQKAGADQAESLLHVCRLEEITAEAKQFNLMRTMTTETLTLRAIRSGRSGKVTVNRLDAPTLAKAVQQCMEATSFVQGDAYAGIAEHTQNARFHRGALAGESETMACRLVELAKDVECEYPHIVYELSGRYTHEYEILINSNGVEYVDERGIYTVDGGFTAVRDGQSTSFGPGACFQLLEPDVRYIELDGMRSELERTMSLLDPVPAGKKFTGTLLAMPTFCSQFFNYLSRIALADISITSGTSRLLGHIGEQVADARINWAYRPYGPDIMQGERFTPDGYRAEDFTVIENGILRSYLLTRYGAAKSGLARAANSGSGICVHPGKTELAKIIQGIEHGVIIGRYSGTEPGVDGEISGVAKNGFLIENGKVTRPIVETMVSGNLFSMLRNVRDISAEAKRDGTRVMPWIAFEGITIK